MELQYFFGGILAAGSMLVFPEFCLGRRRISGLCRETIRMVE
jgi:hypothetical protein